MLGNATNTNQQPPTQPYSRHEQILGAVLEYRDAWNREIQRSSTFSDPPEGSPLDLICAQRRVQRYLQLYKVESIQINKLIETIDKFGREVRYRRWEKTAR